MGQADEEKLVEHLRQEQRRAAYQRHLQAMLRAPAAPAQAIKEGFRPLMRRWW